MESLSGYMIYINLSELISMSRIYLAFLIFVTVSCHRSSKAPVKQNDLKLDSTLLNSRLDSVVDKIGVRREAISFHDEPPATKKASRKISRLVFTFAEASVNEVGMIGQSSNLLINDLEEIKDFLEKQRSLLDFLDEPY